MKQLVPLLIFLSVFGCKPAKNHEFSVNDLHINWSVIENLGGTYANNWKITNQGDAVFPSTDWTIYYNHVVGVPVPESISGSLQITQISGTFYSITPSESFTALGPGESTSVNLVCSGSGIKITDAPSGVYLVINESEPQVIENFEMGPFPPADLMKRAENDNVPIPTTKSRFIENQGLSVVQESELPVIIPTPLQVSTDAGTFKIPTHPTIGYRSELANEATLLLEKLKLLQPGIRLTDDFEKSDIQLDFMTGSNQPESYQLQVTPETIRILGSGTKGVYYGSQSLIALWPLESVVTKEIRCQTINDAPRFDYRGLHLDVARNFQQAEAIKKTLDIMSFYKLNKLHLHLTDDEGWRLQIDKLPELTSYGAVRGHSTDEKDFLYPAYGSGPFPEADDNFGSGFYSRETFIDILKHATARHIEVIPEINFPGHARAAVKAMQARARRIRQAESGETTYLLDDPEDQSEYLSVQGYNDNVICPCQESVYQFLELVVAEVVSMYQEAGAPLTTIHTGGDEVPAGIWENSPLCKQFLAENPQLESTQDLQVYFLQRYNQILQQQDLATAGWEEIALERSSGHTILEPNLELRDQNLIPYVWNSNWGTHDDLAYKLANAGFRIVMCNANNLYFDFAYNKDPMEPGFYWSGLVDTRKPYELVPYDIAKTATVDIMGNPLDYEELQDHVKLTAEGRQNVLGIQGQLWSETVKGAEMLEYYLFPKLIGLAERAWASDPSWSSLPRRSDRLEALNKQWNLFVNKLAQTELPRLDQLWNGVNYRVPLPGAVIEEGLLKANVAFPGLQIRYTTDGKEPVASSTLYEGPVEAQKQIKLKAFTSTGKSSRTSSLGY